MAKRFIDTELFNDEWFMELSKEGKLFYLYLITNCDHAGIIKLNKKLCSFQTKINNIETVIKELDNRLLSVKDGIYYLTKYIHFQYPNFPNSKVKQQESAINILEKYGLFSNGCLTVKQVLDNSYDNVIDIDSVNDSDKKEKVYRKFKHLLLTNKEFDLLNKQYTKEQIDSILDDIENYKDNKKYVSLNLTARKWLKKNEEQIPKSKIPSLNWNEQQKKC